MKYSVMIRSHTGAMVPYRDGIKFRVITPHPLITVLTAKRIEGGFIHTASCYVVTPNEIELLHYPLHAGDEIEVFTEDGDWHRRKCTDHDLNMILLSPETLKYYRHASPDLRDSPDYKP